MAEAKKAKAEVNAPFEIPYTDWKPQYLYSLGEVSRFFRCDCISV